MKLLRKYLLPCFIIFLVFALCSCKTEKNPIEPANPNNPNQPVDPSEPTNPNDPNQPVDPSEPTNPEIPGSDMSLSYDYVNPSIIPYYAEWLDKNYPRPNNVEVKNEGLSEYPIFGKNFKTNGSQERVDVYNECQKLTSIDTTVYPRTNLNSNYNMMDQNGNLLKIDFANAASPTDAVDTGMDLYKHTASEGMYFGNVSDEEPAVVKRIVTNGKGYGTVMTGLYAPAGEVIKVSMPASSLRDRNIYISIGQITGSGQAFLIPANTSKSFVRMPIISTRFRMNKQSSYYDEDTDTYHFYIGSFLGGPIYLMPTNASSKADTSEFDFTISGAVNYRHYIHGITTKEEFEYTSKSSAPYFDLDVRWMEGVRHSGPVRYASNFSYEQLEKVADLWENLGKISNQVPNWCPGKGNIVYLYDNYVVRGAACAINGHYTVNAPYGWMTGSLNYEGFITNGSWGNIHEYNHHYQKFGLSGDSNEITNNAINLVEYALFTKISAARTLEGGLGGWNAYTMPQYALKYLVDENTKNKDARSSLHVYSTLLHNIGADAFIDSAKRGSNPAGYYNNLVNGTHLDMTYFFKELLNYDDAALGGAEKIAEVKSKNYPMFVPVNTVYQVGRVWKKDNVKQYARTAQPFIYGSGDYILDFENNLMIPEGFTYKIKSVTQPKNGQIILKDDKHLEYKCNEEKISGEFFVTLEVKKNDNAFEVEDVVLIINLQKANILERTTWSYTEEAKPNIKNVDELKAFYEGLNYTDTNAKTGDNINSVQNSNTEIWGAFATDPYSIMEVKGALHINADGKYRIALRGRQYALLYLSYDGGKTYRDVIKLTHHTSGAGFMPNDYVDVDLEAGSWVHIKAVLYNDYNGAYIGVGLGRFGADTDGESTSDSVNVSYISGYRNESFLEELFIATPYKSKDLVYEDVIKHTDQALVDSKYAASVNDNPKYDNSNLPNYSLDNVFDDDESNVFWSTGNTFGEQSYSETSPFEITVDLGEKALSNRFTIYYPTTSSFDHYFIKNLEVYAGETKENMQLVYSTKEGTKTNNAFVVEFEEAISLRYYKLVVKGANRSDNQFALRKLEWSFNATGEIISPNAKILEYYQNDEVIVKDAVVYTKEWNTQSMPSTFGTIQVGSSTSEASFKFEGSRIQLRSFYGTDFGTFDIYIDGVKVSTEDLSKKDGFLVSYDSGWLENGEHTITMKGNKGNFNLDAFIIYK